MVLQKALVLPHQKIDNVFRVLGNFENWLNPCGPGRVDLAMCLKPEENAQIHPRGPGHAERTFALTALSATRAGGGKSSCT
jgi:hypothetical protein